jgi:hypothetical protein
MPARREDQFVICANALHAMKLPPEAMLDGRFILQQDADVPPVESEQTEPVEDLFIWGDARRRARRSRPTTDRTRAPRRPLG